jgi:inorganic pyrophosphatase
MNFEKSKMTADKIKLSMFYRNSKRVEINMNMISKSKRMRFDRMLFSSMMYPADYGFIPETLHWVILRCFGFSK